MSDNPDIRHEAIELLSNKVLKDIRFNLTTLIVDNCKIGDKGAGVLGATIYQSNCRLRHLDISNNNIRQTGAQLMSEGLSYNTSLVVLFMHWNPIGPEGGEYIAKSLADNKVLMVLDLSFCNIGHKKEYLPPSSLENASY